jgi:hypothetical protein
MPRRNPASSPATLITRQARDHAEAIGRDWRRISRPGDEPPNYDDWAEALTPFLREHPMRRATQQMASLHECGHLIAFERLGMVAAQAHIEGSAFGRGGWAGKANALNHAYRRLLPPYWDPEEFRGEAISAFAGPVAEELWGDGDALDSIGELLGASLCAEFPARLRGEDGESGVIAVKNAVACAISLAEQYGPAMREIAALLSRRKRISRWQPSVLKILQAIPQGPFDAGPLSACGQTLHDKIVAGIEHMLILSREVVAGWKLAEAAL